MSMSVNIDGIWKDVGGGLIPPPHCNHIRIIEILQKLVKRLILVRQLLWFSLNHIAVAVQELMRYLELHHQVLKFLSILPAGGYSYGWLNKVIHPRGEYSWV